MLNIDEMVRNITINKNNKDDNEEEAIIVKEYFDNTIFFKTSFKKQEQIL